MKIAITGKRLPEQLAPDDSPLDFDQAPVRLMRKYGLSEAGNDERISDAGSQRESEKHDAGRAQFAKHEEFPLNEMQRREQKIDQLDPDERHDQAAEAVDQQVVAQ